MKGDTEIEKNRMNRNFWTRLGSKLSFSYELIRLIPSVVRHTSPSLLLLSAFLQLHQENILTLENKVLILNHPMPDNMSRALIFLHHSTILNEKIGNYLNNHINPFDLAQAFKSLNDAEIFDDFYCELLVGHAKPRNLVQVLIHLKSIGLATNDNVILASQHENHMALSEGFAMLDQARIANETYVKLLIQHPKPQKLANAFKFLHQAGICFDDLEHILAKHRKPYKLAQALRKLHQNGILKLSQIKAVAKHSNFSGMADALCILNENNILTEKTQRKLRSQSNPSVLARVFCYFNKMNMLIEENYSILAQYKNLEKFSYCLNIFDEAGILTYENVNWAGKHPKLGNLVQICRLLNDAFLLNQNNFDALVNPIHHVLLDTWAFNNIWARIPYHLLNQLHLQGLFNASEQAAPLDALVDMREIILRDRADRIFNASQSTHTASVHRTVSKSAIELQRTYANMLDFNHTMKTITNYVLELDDLSIKNVAAKRCILRLSNNNCVFHDPVSHLSVKQLLCLFYIAIHDDNRRIGTLKDAKIQFIEALYEIQRGYNIDEQGIDDLKTDSYICVAGSFNKLIEKLVGIHKKCEILYITPQTASLKLKRVIDEEAKKFLHKKAEYINSSTSTLAFFHLIEHLKKEGVSIIWEQIKPNVSSRMYDEFSDIHGLDVIINAGEYTYIDEQTLKIIQSDYMIKLVEELDEHTNGVLLALNKNSFWSNRHDSAESQKAFDRYCGLSVLNI